MAKKTSEGHWGELRKVCQHKIYVSSEYVKGSLEIIKTPNTFISVLSGSDVTGFKYTQSLKDTIIALQNKLNGIEQHSVDKCLN